MWIREVVSLPVQLGGIERNTWAMREHGSQAIQRLGEQGQPKNGTS